jgi:hypothetical protein
MPERIQLKLAEDSPHGKAGQIVTLALTPQDVHDPTELPTYLAGYREYEFRADEASPVILVDNEQDKFRTFNKDDAFRRMDVKIGAQAPIPEVDPGSSLSSYQTIYRAAGSFIPVQTEKQTGNNYNPRQRAAANAARRLYIDRELDVWALLGTATNFVSANRFALGGGFQWGNLTTAGQGANSDPMFDLQMGIVTSAQPIAGTWFNQKTAFAFLRHPNVRNHMRQMLGDGAVNAMILAVQDAMKPGQNVDFSIPGLPPFHVSAAKVKNESTGNLDYILPDGVVIGVVRPPGVPTDGQTIATSYTFRLRGPSGVGFETREYFVDGRGPYGGTMVVASMSDIAKFTGTDCGFIITAALQ